MINHRHIDTSRPDRRHGFTLIEMLMTLVLSSVLLAGLWTLFDAYTRLFQTGQRIASESRLARAVLDQFSADLDGLADVSVLKTRSDSAIAIAGLGESSSSSSSSSFSSVSTLPQFRLTGTADRLRINTFKPGPPRITEEEDSSSQSLSSQLEDPEYFAPDLRVVLYDFTAQTDEFDSGSALPTGLIRRELDWQSALALGSNDEDEPDDEFAIEDEELASDDLQFLSDNILEDMEIPEIINADLNNEQFLWVPEIVKLQFRYSDGQTWSESWDSHYRGALPALIEISLDFDYERGVDARYVEPEGETDALSEAELEADEEALDPEENLEDLLEEDEEELPQYRRVIALKTAFEKRSSSSSSSEEDSDTALSRLQDAGEESDGDEFEEGEAP